MRTLTLVTPGCECGRATEMWSESRLADIVLQTEAGLVTDGQHLIRCIEYLVVGEHFHAVVMPACMNCEVALMCVCVFIEMHIMCKEEPVSSYFCATTHMFDPTRLFFPFTEA